MAAAEITDVEVTASGFDVRIIGTVDQEEKLALVESIPPKIEGVGEVETNVVYQPPIEARELVIESDPLFIVWDAGGVTVSGTLSTEGRVTQVVDAVGAIFPSVESSGLVVKEGLDDEDWMATVLTIVRDVAEANPIQADPASPTLGSVVVNPAAGLVTVSAEFETRQQQRDIRDDVEGQVNNTTLAFSSGLTVKERERPTRQEVEQAQTTIDELIEGKVVEFEFDSAVITPVGEALLDEVLDALRQFPLVPIEIGGHTDNVGSPESNLELSRERAEAVLAYLVARGEDPERFVVVGYGEEQPVASNDSEQGRARNRRIAFVAIFEEEPAEGEE